MIALIDAILAIPAGISAFILSVPMYVIGIVLAIPLLGTLFHIGIMCFEVYTLYTTYDPSNPAPFWILISLLIFSLITYLAYYFVGEDNDTINTLIALEAIYAVFAIIFLWVTIDPIYILYSYAMHVAGSSAHIILTAKYPRE